MAEYCTCFLGEVEKIFFCIYFIIFFHFLYFPIYSRTLFFAHTWPRSLELTAVQDAARRRHPRASHAHGALFKIIYNSTKPGCCCGFCATRLVGRLLRPSLVRSVDPRQLLHDLDDFVHGGLALHAAAVVDLEAGHRKWVRGRSEPGPDDSGRTTVAVTQRGRFCESTGSSAARLHVNVRVFF